MLSYKEFYIWLEGYLHGKLENKHIDITPIVEKMGQVKDDTPSFVGKPKHDWTVPIPVNPFPRTDNPTPPWTITCETKQQLND